MEGSSTHLRCSVHIDLCALERNLGKLKFFKPEDAGHMALVSADAFGYGVEAATVRLMLSGADAFAVSNVSEGIKVREVGSGWRIVVLSPSLPDEEAYYIENSLTPVLASSEEIRRFEEAAKELRIDVHMRLPVSDGHSAPSPQEAEKMLKMLMASKSLCLEALCIPGTGSGAPNEGDKADIDFLNYVEKKLEANAQKIFVHHSDVCDTAAIPKAFKTCLRAGLVLFGIRPSKNSILSGFIPEDVLTFRSSVSLVKHLPAGATVGYGNTYKLKRDSKVALLSLGYGDGIPREAGTKMDVLIRGKRAPVIGRVSMDQACIDATDLDSIEEGDEAIIVGECGGEKITIEEYCQRLGITPAQALTSITKRVARFYKTLY